MKIKMTPNKKEFTLNDIEAMELVIDLERHDACDAKGWSEFAIREALKNDFPYSIIKIYEATATTALNCRIWDAYGDGTRSADVWIETVAETTAGFIRVGAYLTDIWQTGSIDYKDKLFIELYKKGA